MSIFGIFSYGIQVLCRRRPPKFDSQIQPRFSETYFIVWPEHEDGFLRGMLSLEFFLKSVYAAQYLKGLKLYGTFKNVPTGSGRCPRSVLHRDWCLHGWGGRAGRQLAFCSKLRLRWSDPQLIRSTWLNWRYRSPCVSAHTKYDFEAVDVFEITISPTIILYYYSCTILYYYTLLYYYYTIL